MGIEIVYHFYNVQKLLEYIILHVENANTCLFNMSIYTQYMNTQYEYTI